MACHYLYLKNQLEFYSMMRQRDPELIIKMVKCVLSTSKRNKAKIDIFDITFKDTSSLVFTIDRPQYKDLLNSYLDDLIKMEEYELCGEITKIINKKERKKKTEKIMEEDI
jgi:hypothetical protein